MQQEQIIASTCAYCGVGCGVDITIENNKATKLTGTKEHPANFGRLCVKGTNLLDTVDVTGRLLKPEINSQQVSWETATKEVAAALSATIEKYGKNSVAFYASGQLLTEDYYVANKLMKGYIGSGNIDTNSRLCMSSAVAAYKRAFGEDVVPCDYQDLETTELLLITGSNAAWTHPVLFQRIERAKKINPNMKIVVIDPRLTATGEFSDIFLPLKPGTDAAFFNGLLNYLYEHKGIDEQYIQQHTKGFEKTLSIAKEWSLEKVSQYCEVKIEDLQSIYQLYCQSSSAVTLYSMGINQSSSGVDKCNAIINCHLASGKIAKRGSGPFSITGQPNAMGGREVGGLANQLTAHLDIENPAHRAYVQDYWQSPTMAENAGTPAIEMFDAIERGEIKAVWIMATNPAVSIPDNEKVVRALTKCPLVIVSDCVEENDTLAFADIKLPATPWLEKDGIVTNSERRISRQRPAHSPADEAKHDWEIISEVATAMGFSGFNYQHPSEIFTEFAGLTTPNNISKRVFDISGLSALTPLEYEQLNPVQWPVNTLFPEGRSRVFHDGMFSTPDNKACFISIKPRKPQNKTSEKYSFTLNSGRLRDHWHTMTRTGRSSRLTQHTDKPYIYLNPEDMKALELSDNELVTLSSEFSSPSGNVVAFAKEDKGILKKNSFLPIHWNKQFASQATVSGLYPSTVDPISFQAEMKQSAIYIEKSQFTQFGYCFISDELLNRQSDKNLLQVLKSTQDFWLKNKTDYGVHYSIAKQESAFDVIQWSKELVSINVNEPGEQGEWLSFGDEFTKYVIYLRDTKLMYVGYFSPHWPEYEPAWIAHVFAKPALAFSDIQALLLGQASAEYSVGKQVCSCFNIGEKAIVNEIKAGANSVEKLGERLKCGTNCGSCKPELSQLIKQHAGESRDLIHLESLIHEH